MEKSKGKKERAVAGRGLIDFVFSWSLKDVLDDNFYKQKVSQIPMIFSSVTEYKKAFILPLLEETHADLSSSMDLLSRAPICQIVSITRIGKDHKSQKDLFYSITMKSSKARRDNAAGTNYEPQSGDIFAITEAKPESTGDLVGPKKSYVIAIVIGRNPDRPIFSVLSSKPLLLGEEKKKTIKGGNLLAVNLINLTTNIRIWEALIPDAKHRNLKVIQQVLQTNFIDVENCSICQQQNQNSLYTDMLARMRFSELNDSQQAAVLSCIHTRGCSHQSSVKLIWGPPGTGKTKTVGFLLHSLLKMRCRTLTCAPTNTAILEVAERLLKAAKGSLKHDTYGLGDIVLFGNGERMKIEDRHELLDVFLEHRVDALEECFVSSSGWKDSLTSMTGFLEHPERLYAIYLRDRNVQDVEEGTSGKISKDKKALKNVIVETLKRNKDKKAVKKDLISFKGKNQPKSGEEREKDQGEEGKKYEKLLTYEELIKLKFNHMAKRLSLYIVNLYTHLPTSLISKGTVENMIRARNCLKSFQKLLDEEPSGCSKFSAERTKCLCVLKSLPQKFPLPDLKNRREIKKFCLENSCLIFCTVSSSAKLYEGEMSNPLELVIIDEAAQLKECESAIPLQLPGVQHAILIGDELQLPVMVKSKISEEAGLGRSLFERLAMLGHKKHLLNVQHRMQPSISLFPNEEFYGYKILDGDNVKGKSYNRRFLDGRMFGSYSFINVAHGKEEFDNTHSLRNMVEVAVISEIVSRLYKKFVKTKKSVRIGVISPYMAQVCAIQENLKTYSGDENSDFSISVRSVDGFQGGEEDIIIISTVRCNENGSIGFLSNRQRANVGLTRARYSLWILGNADTLMRSGSVWKKLVVNAKKRRCFHDSDEDTNLAYAIAAALVDLNQLNVLLNLDSLLFRIARWKVCFDEAFWRSMVRIKNNELCKKAFSLLEKLSMGWREPQKGRNCIFHDNKVSSQLLEYYKVHGQLYLVWTIDILQENSSHIQVLKVLDILPLSNVSELAKKLENDLFKSYELDKISRCEYKCRDRNMIVPMRWPVSDGADKPDPVQYYLLKRLAALSVSDD